MPDENVEAYGQVVWFWRRDAGVKLAGAIRPATVTTSPLTGKSTKYAVKPLRRGCRCVHRSPVCSCAAILLRSLAHETAGAARTRHSLRPLFRRRDNEIWKTRAEAVARRLPHTHSS